MYYLVRWHILSACDWMLILKGKDKDDCRIVEIIKNFYPSNDFTVGLRYDISCDDELIYQDTDLEKLRDRAYLEML